MLALGRYRHLAVWKYDDDVIAVRFGECPVLGEPAANDILNELSSVATREDCHRLILNFGGVVVLSRAMLRSLLTLRKKMKSRDGMLVLCDLGPEVRDVFAGTRLEQMFDVMGTEEEAIKHVGHLEPIVSP
jgi:anti-anti-sigma factor